MNDERDWMDVAAKMAHYYPAINWRELSMPQLEGYLSRTGDFGFVPSGPMAEAQFREIKTYRMENNI